MKVGLVTQNVNFKSVNRIFGYVQKYSDAKLIDIKKLRIGAIPNKWDVFYPKFRLSDLDAVLFRDCSSKPPTLDFRLMLSEHLEKMGIRVFNGSKATRICKNKFSAIQFLQERGIPTPATRLALTPGAAVKSIKSMKKPVIIKLLSGSLGKGVIKINSNAEADAIMDTLNTLGQMIYFQEYIETNGEDIRAFVIGDKVVAAMKRVAANGDFRSNIYQGAKGFKIELDGRLEKLALKAAHIVGADIAGVDIILGDEPKVIEVNINPGLRIARITKTNIPDMIARYVCGVDKKE